MWLSRDLTRGWPVDSVAKFCNIRPIEVFLRKWNEFNSRMDIFMNGIFISIDEIWQLRTRVVASRGSQTRRLARVYTIHSFIRRMTHWPLTILSKFSVFYINTNTNKNTTALVLCYVSFAPRFNAVWSASTVHRPSCRRERLTVKGEGGGWGGGDGNDRLRVRSGCCQQRVRGAGGARGSKGRAEERCGLTIKSSVQTTTQHSPRTRSPFNYCWPFPNSSFMRFGTRFLS